MARAPVLQAELDALQHLAGRREQDPVKEDVPKFRTVGRVDGDLRTVGSRSDDAAGRTVGQCQRRERGDGDLLEGLGPAGPDACRSRSISPFLAQGPEVWEARCTGEAPYGRGHPVGTVVTKARKS